MSTRLRKIIYIVGLSHSGSTILDMLLTTAGKAVGLGQVWTVLREDPVHTRTRICSCGASAPECEVWGAVLERLARLPDDAVQRDRYQVVLDVVDGLYRGGGCRRRFLQACQLPRGAERDPGRRSRRAA